MKFFIAPFKMSFKWQSPLTINFEPLYLIVWKLSDMFWCHTEENVFLLIKSSDASFRWLKGHLRFRVWLTVAGRLPQCWRSKQTCAVMGSNCGGAAGEVRITPASTQTQWHLRMPICRWAKLNNHSTAWLPKSYFKPLFSVLLITWTHVELSDLMISYIKLPSLGYYFFNGLMIRNM